MEKQGRQPAQATIAGGGHAFKDAISGRLSRLPVLLSEENGRPTVANPSSQIRATNRLRDDGGCVLKMSLGLCYWCFNVAFEEKQGKRYPVPGSAVHFVEYAEPEVPRHVEAGSLIEENPSLIHLLRIVGTGNGQP